MRQTDLQELNRLCLSVAENHRLAAIKILEEARQKVKSLQKQPFTELQPREVYRASNSKALPQRLEKVKT
jgi:hypothetical protein